MAKSAKHYNMTDLLPRIQTPTLAVWGRQDQITPLSVAEEFRALLPNADLAYIDRCGHAPPIEAPGAFARAVRAFFAEHDY